VTPSSGWYAAGATVTITATPSSGTSFVSFSGTTNSNSNPLSVTMNGPVTETASFGVVYTISVLQGSATAPPGGTAFFLLQVQPAGYPGQIILDATLNPYITCKNTPQYPASGLTPPSLSSNGDGTISVLVGVNQIIGGCSGMVYTVSLPVSGNGPLIPTTMLTMQLTVQTSATLSMSAVLLSQTAGTATYAVTSYANFNGAVNFGLAAGTCATLMITGSGNGVSATALTTLQTAPNAAVMTSPPPGATIPGGQTSFSWSTVSGATSYCLYAGTVQQATCSGSVSSPASVALPTSSTVVYATLGTQVNGVWQYQQCAYTVNPSPSTAPLVLSGGPAVARVGNNGMEVQYVYRFTGGDPTRLTQVTTSLNGAGVTSRIVKQTSSTVTIGLTAAPGTRPQPMEVEMCGTEPDEPCAIPCDPDDPTCVEPPGEGGGGGGGEVDDTNISVSPTEVSAGPAGVPITFTFVLSWDADSDIMIDSASFLGTDGTVTQAEGANSAWVTVTFNMGVNPANCTGSGCCTDTLNIVGSDLLSDGSSNPVGQDTPICVNPYTPPPPPTPTVSLVVTDFKNNPVPQVTIKWPGPDATNTTPNPSTGATPYTAPTTSSGGPLSSAGCLLVTKDPTMPQFTATLQTSDGSPLTGTVQWGLNVTFMMNTYNPPGQWIQTPLNASYPGICQSLVGQQGPLPAPTGATFQPDWCLAYAGQQYFSGGQATLTAYYGNQTLNYNFCILGTNPDPGTANSYLTSNRPFWFENNVALHETQQSSSATTLAAPWVARIPTLRAPTESGFPFGGFRPAMEFYRPTRRPA